MRAVFMGTPAFAVPCIETLSGMPQVELVGVFTQPDRPKGRGYHTAQSPVKEKAVQLGLPVYQPDTAKDFDFVKQIDDWNPDVVVVVAYGLFLPNDALHLPKYGCVNVHASLLPFYRGAAPIQRCLIDGCKETGITTIRMDEGMDTGPILLRSKLSIRSDETSITLHERLAELGASTLQKTIVGMLEGSLEPLPQDHRQATYAPRLTRESGRIDWNENASKIDSLIRGTQPWPTAHTTLNNKMLKIWKARVIPENSEERPGTITAITNQGIVVSTGGGSLLVEEIQAEGKKRMAVQSFIKGNTVIMNTILGD